MIAAINFSNLYILPDKSKTNTRRTDKSDKVIDTSSDEDNDDTLVGDEEGESAKQIKVE